MKSRYERRIEKILAPLFEDFDIQGTTLVKYSGNKGSTDVPNGVTVIGSKAFSRNKDLWTVVLPKTVTTIQHEAFHHCPSLHVVIIPPNVTNLEGSPFRGCKNVTIKAAAGSAAARYAEENRIPVDYYIPISDELYRTLGLNDPIPDWMRE